VEERVTAIWRNDGSGWRALAPAGFPDEQALHRLVEEAPQLLPLSGSPRLAVIGKEVPLGGGFADLLTVESLGRLTVIEVKLAKNAEARRAIVSQVLTYAAFLRDFTPESVSGLVSPYLHAHGMDDLHDAVEQSVQDGSFEAGQFDAGLADCLADGRFRLVLVLDAAPAELIHLVGYLESVGNLVIDLVTVSAYQVGDDRLLVPQRVDPGRMETPSTKPASAAPKGQMSDGSSAFAAFLQEQPEDKRKKVEPMLTWARELEHQQLAHLRSYVSPKAFASLLPYVLGEDVGLVSIYSDGTMQGWRSVFERRAGRVRELLEKSDGAGSSAPIA
jgi:hypothetical protein